MKRETDEELNARIKQLEQDVRRITKELRAARKKRDGRRYGWRTPAAQVWQQRDDEWRKLALDLIDTGFKEVAKELHPDRGGSHAAMARLNKVRARLKAGT